mmetsp:Transcript_73809/g.171192  ORF Transcript_73809/g.171192 Transcript_73809/m.171192 type:complete len:248 (+) Transcript_73809:118-861(+)
MEQHSASIICACTRASSMVRFTTLMARLLVNFGVKSSSVSLQSSGFFSTSVVANAFINVLLAASSDSCTFSVILLKFPVSSNQTSWLPITDERNSVNSSTKHNASTWSRISAICSNDFVYKLRLKAGSGPPMMVVLASHSLTICSCSAMIALLVLIMFLTFLNSTASVPSVERQSVSLLKTLTRPDGPTRRLFMLSTTMSRGNFFRSFVSMPSTMIWMTMAAVACPILQYAALKPAVLQLSVSPTKE